MIETSRLLHKQVVEGDRDDFIALLSSDISLRYISDRPSIKEISENFDTRLIAWNRYSEHWLCLKVIEKESSNFIGVTGFRNIGGSAEVGFLLLPPYTGLGYGTESLRGLVGYAFSLGFESLVANITEGNIASIKVVEKCGFQHVDTAQDSLKIGGKYYSDLKYSVFNDSLKKN